MRGRIGRLEGAFRAYERRRLERLAKSGGTSLEKVLRVLAMEYLCHLEDIELEKLSESRRASFPSAEKGKPRAGRRKRTVKRSTVSYSPEVLSQDLSGLPPAARARIHRGIEAASASPNDGSTPLSGSLGKPRRIDIGDHAVVFDWNSKEGRLRVYAVIARSTLYGILGPRLRQIAEIPAFFK